MSSRYHFDQNSAECLVFTYKEGLLAAVAHDLKIRVSAFTIDVDTEAQQVRAEFEARSLRVVCAIHNGKDQPTELSRQQKREIETNIVRDVLHADRFPVVGFASTAVEERDRSYRVKGKLRLHGVERTITVPLRRDQGVYLAEVRLHQPDFGITPYSALLGALKVKAEVTVRVRIEDPRQP